MAYKMDFRQPDQHAYAFLHAYRAAVEQGTNVASRAAIIESYMSTPRADPLLVTVVATGSIDYDVQRALGQMPTEYSRLIIEAAGMGPSEDIFDNATRTHRPKGVPTATLDGNSDGGMAPIGTDGIEYRVLDAPADANHRDAAILAGLRRE